MKEAQVEKIGTLHVVAKDADGVTLSNGLHIVWEIAKLLGIEPVFQRSDEGTLPDGALREALTEEDKHEASRRTETEPNKWLLSGELDQLKRGVGRKDYPSLAESFRRNVELGLTILGDMRPPAKGDAPRPTYSAPIRTEAEALVKENLLRLRSLVV
jgi:hypothetical protein